MSVDFESPGQNPGIEVWCSPPEVDRQNLNHTSHDSAITQLAEEETPKSL
jgi:hypothetical protein